MFIWTNIPAPCLQGFTVVGQFQQLIVFVLNVCYPLVSQDYKKKVEKRIRKKHLQRPVRWSPGRCRLPGWCAGTTAAACSPWSSQSSRSTPPGSGSPDAKERTLVTLQLKHRAACGSGGRAGWLLTRRLLVWSPAPPSGVSRCPWARRFTLTAPDELAVALRGWLRRWCVN